MGTQDGRLYISDTFNHRVRIVSPAGWIWTVAGTGQAGWGGDGGPATRATLHTPTGMCIGPDGSLYIADQGSHVVRRIRPDATIETVAGIGRSGFSGDDGPATEAHLSYPAALAFLPDGTLLIADQGNHRIRALGSDDRIRTFAGTGTAGFGGDSGPASSALLNRPTGVATDPWGRVFISDRLNHALRLVTSTGIISTVGTSSGEAFDPHALFVDGSGAVVVTDTRGQVIRRLAPAESSVHLTVDQPRIRADGQSVARLMATATDNAPIAWSIIGGVGELIEVGSPGGDFEAELITHNPGQIVVRAMSPGSWGTTVSVQANPTRALSVIDASSTFLANGANEGWVTFGLRELVVVPSGISEGQMSFTVERGDADLRQSTVQVVDGLASVRFVTRRPGNIVIAALAQGAVSLSSRVRASEPSPWQWPDAYEPDTVDSGVLLEGKALDRTLHSKDDTDWFRLPVAPGHYYTFETESEEDAQIEVRLGAGQVLARGEGRVRVGPEFDSGLATIRVTADGDMPYRLIWRIDRAATLSASSPSTDLILDGHSSIPLSVSVLNHLGLVDGGDDTSRVSVEVLSGDAQIVPPKSVISAGRASFQIRPEAIGALRLSIAIPGVESVLYSWDVEAGISLDLGTGDGDDGVRTRHVLRDESVPIEIHYSGGVVDLRGIEIHLDIGSLEFERFDAGPAIEGAEMLIAREGHHLILTSVVLGGTLPTEGGLVGRVHLRFTSDAAEVPVSVVSASKGDPAGIRSLGIGDAAQVRLQTDPDPLTWRGMQEQFGRNRGEDGFNGRYDLNSDGTIGFQDFIQFAETQ